MCENKEDLKKNLMKDEILYKIFINICEYSTRYIKEYRFCHKYKVDLKSIIKSIKANGVNKDDRVIILYINQLISYSLCEVFIDGNETKYIDEKKYYEKLEDMDISLSSLGVESFKEINILKDEKERTDELAKKLELAFDEIKKPYDDKLRKLSDDFEEKSNRLEHMVDSNVVKNIQIISIFSGIISLLFSNIVGIKEFSVVGVRGILILNGFNIILILILILSSQIIIKKDKNK